MRLKNKVAIVTGAASGLGKATAILFAKEGAKVVIVDVNEEKGNLVQNEISKSGGTAKFLKVNITNSDEVNLMVENTIKEFGRVDILINNAGIIRDARLVKMSIEDWQAVIDVNLKGVFLCGQAAAKVMIEQNSGVILNTSSIVGLYGNFGQSNYSATKGGVLAMTKTWARELGKYNIRVNSITPGFIATEILEAMPEKVIEMMKEKTLLKRLGDPKDIANAFLYLASEDAAYVTSTNLSVDGGIVI